jgi:hypothetical protein
MPDSLVIPLLHPSDTVPAAATNLAANAFLAVSDPNLRVMACLRGSAAPPSPTLRWARLQGRIGGALATATKIRVQYHLGGDPGVATGDVGWKTLLDSAGTHTLSTMFVTAPVAIPDEAKIPNLILRAGLFGGTGAVSPTLTCAILNLYE